MQQAVDNVSSLLNSPRTHSYAGLVMASRIPQTLLLMMQGPMAVHAASHLPFDTV